MPETTTMTIRLPEQVKDRLERLAQATERTKTYLAARAIEEFLAAQEWQIEAIRQAVHEADAPGAKFFTHDEVARRLKDKLNRRKGPAK